MKKFLALATLAVATITTSAQAADVGVSVSVGQPGFYGRIDINNYPYPQPRVIYRQPRVIERVVIEREPIYMRVPPGHAKNWRKYCHKYNACGERVYFVRDSWYERDYVPHYREQHGERGDDRHDAYEDNYGRHNSGSGHEQRGKGKGRQKNH
jgi:hypothetical protein